MSRDGLGTDARDLFAQTRGAYDPTASHRARVWWKVERGLIASRRASAPNRWRTRAVAWTIAAAVLGTAGTAAAILWSFSPAAPATNASGHSPATTHSGATASAPVTVSAPAIAATATIASATASAPAAPTEPDASSRRSSAPAPEGEVSTSAPSGAARGPHHARSAGDATRLDEETALLTRAQAATHRGDSAAALALLRTYDEKFGAGALAEERSAARVHALCAAGQAEAARAEAARFVARWPRSPQVARLRDACPPQARPK